MQPWIAPNDGDNITGNENGGSKEHVRNPETTLPDASPEEDEEEWLDDSLGIG